LAFDGLATDHAMDDEASNALLCGQSDERLVVDGTLQKCIEKGAVFGVSQECDLNVIEGPGGFAIVLGEGLQGFFCHLLCDGLADEHFPNSSRRNARHPVDVVPCTIAEFQMDTKILKTDFCGFLCLLLVCLVHRANISFASLV